MKLKKNMWLGELIEDLQERKENSKNNREWLKTNDLRMSLSSLADEIRELAQDNSLDFEVLRTRINHHDEDLMQFHARLRDFKNELKKEISTQKGRITKQTNEQNILEKALARVEQNQMEYEQDFQQIYDRLGNLEIKQKKILKTIGIK